MKKIIGIAVICLIIAILIVFNFGCNSIYPKNQNWSCIYCHNLIVFGNDDIKELKPVLYDQWNNQKGFFCNYVCYLKYFYGEEKAKEIMDRQ